MSYLNSYEKKLVAAGLWQPLAKILANPTDTDKVASGNGGINNVATLADIPAGATGVFQSTGGGQYTRDEKGTLKAIINLPTRIAYDTVAGSGAINGQLTDSGQAYELTAGDATTIINVDHIKSAVNAYIHVNAGAKITKVSQLFRGTICTIAMGSNTKSLSDMIHMNFTGSGAPACMHYNTSTGASGTSPLSINFIAAVPNLNDGVTHELVAELFNDTINAYVDGVLIYQAYHPDYSVTAGNWCFGQLHSSGLDKIYGFSAFSEQTLVDSNKQSVQVPLVQAAKIEANAMMIGFPGDATFNPISKSYFHTSDNNGHVFDSTQATKLKVKASAAGNASHLLAISYAGYAVQLTMDNSAVGHIYAGTSEAGVTERIRFSNGSGRVSLPLLPNAITGLAAGELWQSGAGVDIVPAVPFRGISAAMTAGSITISNTNINSAHAVILTRQTAGGTLGDLSIGTIINGTSFVINSSSAADTSTVFWEIVKLS